ncbi:ferredoxin [Pseudopedobacter saltans DSM 12145]|uniref:Ferredoxin n=2 Tax=Pseudopedobacter saltans TaxID=151895 RepID=F0SCW1_PSESL|nr:ferredoxin [Pseudopedobacter saltans DSM 12145]
MIIVIDQAERKKELEIPEGINLSLMEFLKAADYDIEASCGGIALCATCHIAVLEKEEQIPEPKEIELSMLDVLPHSETNSRLACQIRLNDIPDGMVIRIIGN